MRFEGTRQSKKDDKHTIYLFSFSKEESRLIHDTLLRFVKETKNVWEVKSSNARARTILKRIGYATGLEKWPKNLNPKDYA